MALIHGIFIRFFFKIGFRYVWIIPLIFFMLFVWNTLFVHKSSLNFSKIIEDNSLFIAWTSLILGLRWILHFLNIEGVVIWLILISINYFLFLSSFVFNYKDWENIFQVWYFFSVLILLFQLGDFSLMLSILPYIFVLTFSLYVFVISILGIYISIPSYIKYFCFFLFHCLVVIVIYKLNYGYPYFGLALCQVYVTCVYAVIYYLRRYKIYVQTPLSIDIKYLLDGGRVTAKKKPKKVEFFLSMNDFLTHMPQIIQFLLSVLNIVLIVSIIGVFFMNLENQRDILWQLLYWISILLFFVNFILLKSIDYYYNIQRFFVFFIINFSIYLTIISLFGSDYMTLALIGIAWNIFNSMLIFYSDHLRTIKILYQEDYYYRIGANMLALVCNIVFVLKTEIPNQLKFSLIFFYLGLQAFILLYNMKYIREILPAKSYE